MPFAKVNGIQIEYDTFGNPSLTPLLLIMGLGSQKILWDENFCRQVADHRFYVIRFDNRDVGLSSKFDETGVDDAVKAVGTMIKGDVPYSIKDMVEDSVGLLDTLNIEKAHICGFSMGTSIAMEMAIHNPSRVSSLILICGTTGNTELPPPSPAAVEFLFAPVPEERAKYIEHYVGFFRTFAGNGFPFVFLGKYSIQNPL